MGILGWLTFIIITSHITFCWGVSSHWCLLSWPIFLFWWSFCTSEYFPFSRARKLCSKKKKCYECYLADIYQIMIFLCTSYHQRIKKYLSGRTESLLNRLIKHYLLPLLGSAQVPPLVLICCQKEWTAAFWKQVTVKGSEGGRQGTSYIPGADGAGLPCPSTTQPKKQTVGSVVRAAFCPLKLNIGSNYLEINGFL